MIKSDAKLKKLTTVFNNNNRNHITEAIDILRDEEPFEGAIGFLTSIYDGTVEKEIHKAVENFMNDIKDLSAIPEVIEEIRRGWKPETTRMLVSSCWQSGLDYSSYSSDFAETFVKGDYITAIECFTVIEEFAHELTRKKKDEIIKSLEMSKFHNTNEKNALTHELISFLQK
jgi:hypothetical protein